MNVLVIGSGGREHALTWKLNQSKNVDKIYCAPGNAGMDDIAECVPDIQGTDIEKLLSFACSHNIDFTVVGPEVPLSMGICDAFEAQGLKVFGPSQKAAALESSKVFSKYFMNKYNIPTAAFEVFTELEPARKYVRQMGVPIVIKTDGLAAGKGAVICQTLEEADETLNEMLVSQTFGDAGARVIIEEFLLGEEVSVFILSDGENFKILPCSQDHKAVYDGDTGPNTGGMGAYAPAAMLTPDLMETIIETVAKPSIEGMALEGHPYRGLLYAGLMLTPKGPKLLEYNCRFGDPETQAVLPLIKSDLLELLLASVNGTLDQVTLEVHDKAAVCVVIASGGYPGKYEKGHSILGLDWPFDADTIIFHAGTRRKRNTTVTAGGRVLGVTAVADSIPEAIKKAYTAVGKITFNQAYYRKDIAQKALRNLMK